MKKKITLFLLTLLSGTGFSFAQSFTIGTGTVTNPTNDFGPMRTNATASQWNTNTYIYPVSLISGITPGDRITFGTWASTQINEDANIVKQAATMITLELPQFHSFYTDELNGLSLKELYTNTNAYVKSLLEVFLSNQ
ncbi:MAG: hypothetical protein ABIX01_16600 [Chitinophagaceae bacterium]